MFHDIVTRIMSVPAAQAKAQMKGFPAAGTVRAFVGRNGWFFLHHDGTITTDGSTTNADTPQATRSERDDEFEGTQLDVDGQRNQTTATPGDDPAAPWLRQNDASVSVSLTQGNLVLKLVDVGSAPPPCMVYQSLPEQPMKFRFQLGGALALTPGCYWGVFAGVGDPSAACTMFTYFVEDDLSVSFRVTRLYDTVTWTANRGVYARAPLTLAQVQAPHYVEIDSSGGQVAFRVSYVGLEGTFETWWNEPLVVTLGDTLPLSVGYVIGSTATAQHSSSFTHALTSNWFREVTSYTPSISPFQYDVPFTDFVCSLLPDAGGVRVSLTEGAAATMEYISIYLGNEFQYDAGGMADWSIFYAAGGAAPTYFDFPSGAQEHTITIYLYSTSGSTYSVSGPVAQYLQ